MPQQAPMRPFRYGTRNRIQKVGAQSWAANTNLTFELPRVGYLSRIIIKLAGTMNCAAGSSLTDKGPWSIINRIKVNLNVGSVTLVDLSGYGAYLMSHFVERGSATNKAGIGDTTPHGDIYSAPVANGNNTWELTFVIPIGANHGNDFELGLINLQAPEVRLTAEVLCGQTSDAASVGAGTGFGTATVSVYYDYFEVPSPVSVQQPAFVLHRLLEEIQSITTTGEQIYIVPRMGVLSQLLHVVTLNAARSDSLDSFKIKFNKTDTIYDYERKLKRWEQRTFTSSELPVGVYLHDFWHSSEDLSRGDMRDAIDSEAISTLESIVTVSSGATLGSNNNTLASIRRIVQAVQR